MTAEAIHVLMPKVMAEIGTISKNRTNDHQHFKFRGIDDVMNALNGPLVKHGVFYVPEVLESQYTSYTTSNGTGMRNAVLKVKYTFYGPAGDSIAGVGMGEASDSGDKATSKALSMALKYALLQTFCIATDEDDPDASAHTRVGDAWSKDVQGPECPTCSSPVWDNSQDPNRGKRPKWKCKDKNCGWASWDDDPFEESQAGASQPSTVPPEQGATDVATAAAEAPQAEPVSDPGSASPPWYASWVKQLGADKVMEIASQFSQSGGLVTNLEQLNGATPEQQEAVTKALADLDWTAPEKASA